MARWADREIDIGAAEFRSSHRVSREEGMGRKKGRGAERKGGRKREGPERGEWRRDGGRRIETQLSIDPFSRICRNLLTFQSLSSLPFPSLLPMSYPFHLGSPLNLRSYPPPYRTASDNGYQFYKYY